MVVSDGWLLDPEGLGASIGPLDGVAGSRALLWVGLGPGVNRVWGFLWPHTCRWMKASASSGGHLTWDIPGPVKTSWWVNWVQALYPRGRIPNGTCQHNCLHGRMSSPKRLLPKSGSSELVTGVSPRGVPPASQGDIPRLASGSDSGFVQITALPWVLESVRFCVSSYALEVSISHRSLAVLKLSTTGLQQQTF